MKRFLFVALALIVVIAMVPPSVVKAAETVPPVNLKHGLAFEVQKTINLRLSGGAHLSIATGELPAYVYVKGVTYPHMTAIDGTWPGTTVYRFSLTDKYGNEIKKKVGYLCIDIPTDLLDMAVAKNHYLHYMFTRAPYGDTPWADLSGATYHASEQKMCAYIYLDPRIYYTLVEK